MVPLADADCAIDPADDSRGSRVTAVLMVRKEKRDRVGRSAPVNIYSPVDGSGWSRFAPPIVALEHDTRHELHFARRAHVGQSAHRHGECRYRSSRVAV